MKKSLESQFEDLIQQIKTQQYDGYLTGNSTDRLPKSEKLIKLAEEISKNTLSLTRQREELLFAYQTLEVAYQRYWEFFNYAPDGYLVTDTEGIIQEANQAILSMLSITPTDLRGKTIDILIPEIKRHDLGMQLNWFTGSQQLEVYLQPSGHTPFYASVNIAPQCNIQNKTIGLLWLVRDISERKKMEEDLRKSRTELSLLLEQTPYLLWTTDTGLKLTSISGASLSEFKGSPSEIVGMYIADFFNCEPDSPLAIAHAEALTGRPQTFDFEWRGRIFQSTLETLKNTSERITGVIGAAFDITERKNAEKVLQKSEKFNASLLHHSPYPISVINSDTSISYVNPAFEKLTGFSGKALIGRKAPYPWWPEDEQTKILGKFKRSLSKKKTEEERLFRKNNGEQFWVESTRLLIEGPDESDYYLQTWVDITESKRLRENLEFYMMQITRVQEEERKRIAQELHEETLQSLAALCLATESIIKSRQRDPRSALQDLKDLREKINGVIEEVRRFSYGLRPGVLDYLGLTAALETLTDEVVEKGIKTSLLITGKERPLPPDLEITLFRIVQEALSNIKKYSLATKVTVSLGYSIRKIKLTIRDNGQGFSLPERLSELATEGKLGLIGIEERTRLYGGSFSIHTQPKEGTRITIILPVSDAAPA